MSNSYAAKPTLHLLPYLYAQIITMKKSILLLLFGWYCGLLVAQTPEPYSEVQIDLSGRAMSDLARLGIETDHGQWLPKRNTFTTILSATELLAVQQAGFSTKIQVADVQQDYLERRQQPSAAQDRDGSCGTTIPVYATPANYTYGSMGGYQTYAEMLAVLDDMRAKYPNLITVRKAVSDTILTHEGRPQWYVRISDNADTDEAEPEVLYTALHHAREPNSMAQMLFFMWYLLENYPTNPEVKYIVDQEELYFIPCVNPDGYIYNETTNPQGGGLWRKNRRNNGNGTFGVDLNRNYGYQWGYDDTGSSPLPNTQTYRGPGPFSEPESRMIRDFGVAHEFGVAHNYHTYSNLLIYPWAHSDMPADSTFIKLARLYTRENQYKIGTTSETVGYAVNGDSNDWLYASNGTYAFTPEVGRTGFWPQPGEIEGLNRENVWQNLATALTAGRFGEISVRTPGLTVAQSGTVLPFQLIRYGLEPGPFTVTIAPASSNIASPVFTQTVNLVQFETANFDYPLELQPTVQPGEEVVLLVQLYNGSYTHTDTLRRKFNSQGGQIIFSDPATNLANWTGNWGVSGVSFVSPPTSITDSPGGDYAPNTVSQLIGNEFIAIPANALQPQLCFWAHWELEENYDYVEVQAFGSDNSYAVLCGRYTQTGVYPQDEGQPVFEGQQYAWVEECMDISAFTGLAFSPTFLLSSDAFGEYDGFYFDDLRVEYQDSIVGTQVLLPVGDFRLRQNQPNPSNGLTTIRWENEKHITGSANLLVFNVLGGKVLEQSLALPTQKETQIDTRSWPNGIYTYFLRTNNGQSVPRKMTVIHE